MASGNRIWACALLWVLCTFMQVSAGGVIIENLGQEAPLYQAGVRNGDRLTHWERESNSGANASAAKGEIHDSFDWLLAVNQTAYGTVRFFGERKGRPQVIEVTQDHWKVSVRPTMSQTQTLAYLKGVRLIRAGNPAQGTDVWETLARETASCWLWLQIANTWRDGREFRAADDAYRRALSLARRPIQKFGVLDQMALSLERQFQYKPALEIFRSALAVAETLEEPLLKAAIYHRMGHVAHSRGDMAEAEKYHRAALEIVQVRVPHSLTHAYAVSRLGMAAKDSGQMARAGDYFRQSLGIYEKRDAETMGFAESLEGLGLVVFLTGDLVKAETCFLRSLAIKERLKVSGLGLADTLNYLGILAGQRDNLDKAESYFLRTFKLREQDAPNSPLQAGTCSNLGFLYRKRGDLDKAEHFFLRALEIQETQNPKSQSVCITLGHLGILAKMRGDLPEAERLLQRGANLMKQLAPQSYEYSVCLSDLGDVAMARNQYLKAEAYYLESSEIRLGMIPNSLDSAKILSRLAAVYRAMKQPEKAATHYGQVLDTLELQLGMLGGSQATKIGFLALRQDMYRDYLEFFLEQNQPEQAFNVLERSRSKVFRDMMAERNLILSGEELPKELEAERRRIAHMYEQAQNAKSAEGGRIDHTRLRQLAGQYEEVKRKIREISPKSASVRYPETIDLEGIRNTLDPGTLLLSYYVTKDRTYLFTTAHKRPLKVHHLAIGQAELHKQVRLWVSEARAWSSKSQTEAIAGSKALFDLLIEPARAEIEAAQRLVFIADGPLHALVFDALVMEEQGPRYLVQWKPTTREVSANVYVEQKRRARKERLHMAAFADANYPAKSWWQNLKGKWSAITRSLDGAVLAPLPNSKREVEALVKLFPGEIFTGAQATEERVKLLDDKPAIIHFAVHGGVDDRVPLNSWLALSINPDFQEGEENGILQAWEIFESVRIDADLVVLSACRSGLGKEMGGEGMIGLTRSLQFAGARSLLASWWEVDDSATADFMTRFYTHLKAGKTKDQALRLTKIEFIENRVPGAWLKTLRQRDHTHPFYWASFQLIGPWD